MVDLDIIILSITAAALIAFLLLRHWHGCRQHDRETRAL